MIRSILRALLRLILIPLRRALEAGIARTAREAETLEIPDTLIRLGEPPLPVSRRANREQELDFVKWRSPTYLRPMTDGVVTETVAAIMGDNAPAPFDAQTLGEMCLNCTIAYTVKREGDVWVADLAGLSLYPYRPITISQFRFDLDRKDFSVVDVGGRTHRPGDATWATALTHVMCWLTIAAPAGAHNWVHFTFPDTAASVHDRMTLRDSLVWKLIAPHVRFTNRINYQALWIQRASSNGHSLKQKLTPWLAMPFYADQFRGGILRNTRRHYSELEKHFTLPSTLDQRVPYFQFLKAYYDEVAAFVDALDPTLEDDAWAEFAAGVDAQLPGFAAIPRARALAVLIWQVGVVHISDHLSIYKYARRHGFMDVPPSIDTPFTIDDVSRWDRWHTANFLDTWVNFNAAPGLDQRLLNVSAYGFAPDSAQAAAAQRFHDSLQALDTRLEGEGRALIGVERLVQSVCF